MDELLQGLVARPLLTHNVHEGFCEPKLLIDQCPGVTEECKLRLGKTFFFSHAEGIGRSLRFFIVFLIRIKGYYFKTSTSEDINDDGTYSTYHYRVYITAALLSFEAKQKNKESGMQRFSYTTSGRT